jgi:Ca2+-binding RTX toxin-like protein
VRSIYQNLARFSVLAAASAAVVGGLAVPGYAAAGTAFVTAGNDVHYVGTTGTDKILVTNSVSGVFLEDIGTGTISPGTGCSAVTNKLVRCAAPASEPKVDFVRLDLGGGADEATVKTAVRTTVLGGAGNDTYFGATSAIGTSVYFIGGEGTLDRADYGSSDAGVLVDLGTNAGDDADDGRLNRDHDNIDRTTEALHGSQFDDSLRGNEGNNWIIGRLGADALRGGPGNDDIWAKEFDARYDDVDKADLSCGTGIDRITLDRLDPGTSECETVERES